MGPYANIVNEYRRQLTDSSNRSRTMTELLAIIDFSKVSDEEKLKRAWYIHLVAQEVLNGIVPEDNV